MFHTTPQDNSNSTEFETEMPATYYGLAESLAALNPLRRQHELQERPPTGEEASEAVSENPVETSVETNLEANVEPIVETDPSFEIEQNIADNLVEEAVVDIALPENAVEDFTFGPTAIEEVFSEENGETAESEETVSIDLASLETAENSETEYDVEPRSENSTPSAQESFPTGTTFESAPTVDDPSVWFTTNNDENPENVSGGEDFTVNPWTHPEDIAAEAAQAENQEGFTSEPSPWMHPEDLVEQVVLTEEPPVPTLTGEDFLAEGFETDGEANGIEFSEQDAVKYGVANETQILATTIAEEAYTRETAETAEEEPPTTITLPLDEEEIPELEDFDPSKYLADPAAFAANNKVAEVLPAATGPIKESSATPEKNQTANAEEPEAERYKPEKENLPGLIRELQELGW